MANIVRLTLNLEFYKDGKKVLKRTYTVRAAAIARYEQGYGSEWNSGKCRVWYNKEKDYWNEFEFETPKQFHDTLMVDTEPDLIKEFA